VRNPQVGFIRPCEPALVEAPPAKNEAPPYIGGLTPFVPTIAVSADRAPSAPRLAGTKTVTPGFRSVFVADRG
jgi:hypothetical protein